MRAKSLDLIASSFVIVNVTRSNIGRWMVNQYQICSTNSGELGVWVVLDWSQAQVAPTIVFYFSFIHEDDPRSSLSALSYGQSLDDFSLEFKSLWFSPRGPACLEMSENSCPRILEFPNVPKLDSLAFKDSEAFSKLNI